MSQSLQDPKSNKFKICIAAENYISKRRYFKYTSEFQRPNFLIVSSSTPSRLASVAPLS
jgi:hypothetical protein